MASLWIQSHAGMKRNRKIRELAKTLNMRRSYVAGCLHFLWHEAIENQDDGDLSQWSDDEIAEAADFPAKRASEFVAAMQLHRLMDDRLIHDWPDHAGYYLRQKYAKHHKERLIEIWEKHGREYGSTESQPKVNGNPSSHNNTQPTNLSSSERMRLRLLKKEAEKQAASLREQQ